MRFSAYHLDDLLLLEASVLWGVPHVRDIATALLDVLRLSGLDLALNETLEGGLGPVGGRLDLFLRGPFHRESVLVDIVALSHRDEILERGLDVDAGALALLGCGSGGGAGARELVAPNAASHIDLLTNCSVVDVAIAVDLEGKRVAGGRLQTRGVKPVEVSSSAHSSRHRRANMPFSGRVRAGTERSGTRGNCRRRQSPAGTWASTPCAVRRAGSAAAELRGRRTAAVAAAECATDPLQRRSCRAEAQAVCPGDGGGGDDAEEESAPVTRAALRQGTHDEKSAAMLSLLVV